MKKYFVDTENVGSAWLAIIPELEVNDHVFVMMSNNSPRLSFSFSALQALSPFMEKHSDKIEIIPCAPVVSPNGMDMELVSFMGSIIGSSRSKTAEYIIISNDRGFDPVALFWNHLEKPTSRFAMGQTFEDGTNFISNRKSMAAAKKKAAPASVSSKGKTLSSPSAEGKGTTKEPRKTADDTEMGHSEGNFREEDAPDFATANNKLEEELDSLCSAEDMGAPTEFFTPTEGKAAKEATESKKPSAGKKKKALPENWLNYTDKEVRSRVTEYKSFKKEPQMQAAYKRLLAFFDGDRQFAMLMLRVYRDAVKVNGGCKKGVVTWMKCRSWGLAETQEYIQKEIIEKIDEVEKVFRGK